MRLKTIKHYEAKGYCVIQLIDSHGYGTIARGWQPLERPWKRNDNRFKR